MTRLKVMRVWRGISQSELAEKSGVKKGMIQAYEQGKRSINGAAVVTVKALADALACRIEDLIEEDH